MFFKITMIVVLIKMNNIIFEVPFPLIGESFSKSSSIYSTAFNPHQNAFVNDQLTSHKIFSMKSHIKDILNISTENETLDEYIANHFRTDNPNPAYIFMLPDENNRTLIFHRSDFKERNFPKMPTTNKFENKIFNISNMLEALEMESKLFEETNPNNLIRQFDLTNDNEFDSIITQNVRTERNFIKMLNDINDNPESFTKNPMINSEKKPITEILKSVRSNDSYKSSSRRYEAIIKPQQIESNNDWEELGLQGWSGEIREPINSYKYTAERPPRTETLISNIDIKRLKNYSARFQNLVKFSEANRQLSKSVSDPEESFGITTKQNATVHNANDDKNLNRQVLSEQLSIILAQERKEIKQKYIKSGQRGSIGIPKFPVTSSRAQHSTEYVFVARANNPFGHSTKWQVNNSFKSNSSAKRDVMSRVSRRKRGVLELYSMIKCGTGCDPLIYKGYGCYCGFLGSGKALDGIDKCCAMHDYCYSISSCPMFLEYFVPYLWKCYKGRPLCAIDHGEWGGPGSCAARLCECDRILAKCLRQYYCPHTRAVCTSSPWRLFQNFIMDFGS